MVHASYTLVLASSSPRRRELIENLKLPYEVTASHVDESTPEGTAPSDIVEMLSVRKAEAVASLLSAGEAGKRIVIGSDTIVVLDGEVLGKPEDEEDAFRMLSRLQGRSHQVYTGICCIAVDTGQREVAHRITEVEMKNLSGDRIRSYIATGEPSDKAGSYGIQGIGATLIEKINGDYFNVVGLPVALLSDMLERFGVEVL
ncbi:Maf family protein [Paenibacillus gansuensis]|uniref:dTTP/UTP pyrophosphatase n=1 Tax=Paenibacillus gansuensis TaxID=306542 RepID=A0ABW5PB92_9BACL